MSEQENSEQVATEEKKAEARFNENGVGGTSLVSGHPQITEDDLMAQVERGKRGKL